MSRLFILELDVCDLLEHSNGCSSSNRKMHCCQRARRRSSCVLLMDWVDKNAPNLFSNGPTNQCSFVVEVQLHHTWIYANSYRKYFKNNFCPQCCIASEGWSKKASPPMLPTNMCLTRNNKYMCGCNWYESQGTIMFKHCLTFFR